MRGPVRVVVVVLALAACGEKAPPARASHEGRKPDVTLEVFFGTREKPRFDPRAPDPRVRKAYAQLTELVGHAVAFQFDEALVPKWTSDFDTLFARCIETVAADLAALKRESPGLFEEARKIERVEVGYDARIDDWESALEGERVARIALSPRSWRLVPARAISRAVTAASEKTLVAAFEGKEIASVAPDRYPELLAYLLHHNDRTLSRKQDTTSPASRLATDPRADTARKLADLGLAIRAGNAPPALRTEVTRAAAREVDYFVHVYTTDREIVRAAAPGSWFRRAEGSWAAWLRASEGDLDDETRLFVMERIFDLAGGRAAHDDPRTDVFPGLDLLDMGIRTIDAWARAGHPMPGGGEDKRLALWAAIACPHRRDAEGRMEEYPSGCRPGFFRFAFARDDTKRRLLAWLLERKDPVLVEQAMINTSSTTNTGRRKDRSLAPLSIWLWRGLEPDEGLWQAATRVVAEELASLGDALYDEAILAWRRMPRRRGPLLHVLASMGAADVGRIKWEEVATTLGAPVTAPELAAFLDQGPGTVRLLPAMWPGLGHGWSRGQILASKLDALLGAAGEKGAPRVAEALVEVARASCKDPAGAADRAEIHRHLERRISARADARRVLFAALDATGAGACR